MTLKEYKEKRQFNQTPEPKGRLHQSEGKLLSFVVQKHSARRLHYDFRLEMERVLRSWAVPKGPSLDPTEKRLAVHVEDHPLEYADFEGTIPEGQYGGGTVMVWDHGEWKPEGDPAEGMRRGKLRFTLIGQKLQGTWNLVRIGTKSTASETGDNWLLIKSHDKYSKPLKQGDILKDQPNSITTGRTLKAITEEGVSKQKPAEKIQSKNTAANPLQDWVEPELATLVERPPSGEMWLHETKFDGYRLICRIDNGQVRLITRRNKDWTDRFPTIANAAKSLPVKQALLDGEVVMLLRDGTTNFQALQNAMTQGKKQNLVYFAFDLLHLNGMDLREKSLGERKKFLSSLFENSDGKKTNIRYSDHIVGKGETFYKHACRFALEGIVSKRIDQPYRSGRSENWVKVKCLRRQEFVIAGFTDPTGARKGFGSLLLGVYDNGGKLQYVGRVGTGFSSQSLKELHKRLSKLEQSQSAFQRIPRGTAARGTIHWIKPNLVAEIEFFEWTKDGILRQPSFQGLREDKLPQSVVREEPISSVEITAKGEKQAQQPAKKNRLRKAITLAKGAAEKTPEAVAEGRVTKKSIPARTKQKQENEEAVESSAPKETKPLRKPEATIAGIALTNPDKILFEEQGITKLELAKYYEQVEQLILPYLAKRPLMLIRCPKGAGQKCFVQKHADRSVPKQVGTMVIQEEEGQGTYMHLDSLAGIISLVQLGTLEFHVWNSRRAQLEKPDQMIFDLDPDPSVNWGNVIQAALDIREALEDMSFKTFAKTSGGKGIHIIVPLAAKQSWNEVLEFSRGVAELIENQSPRLYTTSSAKQDRKNRVYIDYLRNSRGATAIAPYSTRARKGAPVSAPIRWEELTSKLSPDQFSVKEMPKRLSSKRKDPWAEFEKSRKAITPEMRDWVGL